METAVAVDAMTDATTLVCGSSYSSYSVAVTHLAETTVDAVADAMTDAANTFRKEFAFADSFYIFHKRFSYILTT